MEDVHCHVLDVFAQPRARAFVVLHYCLCVLDSRLFDRSYPLLYVGFNEVPLVRRFRPFVDECFYPALRPFDDPAMRFPIPFAPEGNVRSPVGGNSRAVVPRFLRYEVLSLPLVHYSVFWESFFFGSLDKNCQAGDGW